MVRGRYTRQAKAAIVFSCLLLITACILFAIGYTTHADEKKHYIQIHLMKTANRIAEEINGDGLLALRPGDEGTPRYMEFARILYDLRKNDTFIVTSYLLRIDNGSIIYVVHDAYAESGLDQNVIQIGEPVTEDKDVIASAAFGQAYSPDIYTSKWGSYLSGYAPVKDSNGTIVGILGVDETADTVFSYQNYQFLNLVEVS
jgi:sensor histidine kinase regulating citrate/malate metabolism